ncbi:MAG: hypothetical protein J0H91_10630, partial [Rhodospirillales bacterium]|nr:hypothetical protein [Rhodospirillales bacterium]
LRLASLPSATGTLVAPRLRPFAERYPLVKVRLLEGSDGEVRDRLRDVLLEDGDLADCTIRTWVKGVAELVHQPPEPTDRIDIRVDDGVVTLDGDVVNGIGVTPPEEDGEAGMTDAVVRVLEKDLFVDAASTRVHSRRDVVTLDGTVLRDAERKLREDDPRYLSAWTGW